MMTNGKTKINFEDIYNRQIKFQECVNEKFGYFGKNQKVEDNPEIVTYHLQQLISEIGEVLAADKRWKNFRNEHIDLENKKEEIADCFIVLMNIAMYSGLNYEDLFETILNKQNKNFKRLLEDK